jgi:acyl carrier protein
MNEQQARDTILGVLRQIAPEADFAELEPDVELREQLDIDSMDFLNFVIGIHEQTGIDIPEEDYDEMASLNGCVRYLVKAGA